MSEREIIRVLGLEEHAGCATESPLSGGMCGYRRPRRSVEGRGWWSVAGEPAAAGEEGDAAEGGVRETPARSCRSRAGGAALEGEGKTLCRGRRWERSGDSESVPFGAEWT